MGGEGGGGERLGTEAPVNKEAQAKHGGHPWGPLSEAHCLPPPRPRPYFFPLAPNQVDDAEAEAGGPGRRAEVTAWGELVASAHGGGELLRAGLVDWAAVAGDASLGPAAVDELGALSGKIDLAAMLSGAQVGGRVRGCGGGGVGVGGWRGAASATWAASRVPSGPPAACQVGWPPAECQVGR